MTKKGKRARNIGRKIEDIASYALKYPDIQRTELAIKIQNEINWNGPAPEIEVLERKISWVRNHVIEGPEDKQWSLGVTIKPEYEIPHEATGDLLAVWRLCLALGYTFTIREAKWVSRLRKALTKEDCKDIHMRTQILLIYAIRYSLREKVCDALNKEMDTQDLDANLAIEDHRERAVYEALDLIPQVAPSIYQKETTVERTEEILSKYLYGFFGTNPVEHVAVSHRPESIRGVNDDENKYVIHYTFNLANNLPPGQDHVYAALLLYLTKGAKWNSLSLKEYLSILKNLKKWVLEVIPSIKVDRAELNPEDVLDPSLLEMVGYKVSTQFKTKRR